MYSHRHHWMSELHKKWPFFDWKSTRFLCFLMLINFHLCIAGEMREREWKKDWKFSCLCFFIHTCIHFQFFVITEKKDIYIFFCVFAPFKQAVSQMRMQEVYVWGVVRGSIMWLLVQHNSQQMLLILLVYCTIQKRCRFISIY